MFRYSNSPLGYTTVEVEWLELVQINSIGRPLGLNLTLGNSIALREADVIDTLNITSGQLLQKYFESHSFYFSLY